MRALNFAIAVCVLFTASEASGQVLTPPPRSSDGLFGGAVTRPNQASHQLSADLLGLGSYEDNFSGGGGGISGPVVGGFADPRGSGTAGVFSATLRYRYGRLRKYFEAGSNGYVHSFRNLDVQSMYGGSADIRVGSNLGRRATFNATATGQYQPTFMLTTDPALPTGGPSDGIAPIDPTGGVLELESRTGTLNSGLDYEWNARHHTRSSIGYQVVRMSGPFPSESRNRGEMLSHSWAPKSSLAVVMSYQHSHQLLETTTHSAHPTNSHTGLLGLEWRKRISRTRTVSIGGGSGAMQVRTISVFSDRPFEYLAPSVNGRARLDLGRTWSVSLDLRRDVSVLEGVTVQSFLTDVGSLWMGGQIGESWVVTMSGSFARGAPHEGETGSMEATLAHAQLQYAFATCCTVVGTYSRYTHFLRDLPSLAPGFPSRIERNSVRVGMTLWLPLYGRFSGTQRFQTGRN